VVYVYGMVGSLLFRPVRDDRRRDALDVHRADRRERARPARQGIEVSRFAVPFFVSYVLIAAFLMLNILSGVVINSMEEARAIEAARERAELSERGGAGDGRGPREKIAALRAALHDLERDLARRAHDPEGQRAARSASAGSAPGRTTDHSPSAS
jgi:hypothetical protein